MRSKFSSVGAVCAALLVTLVINQTATATPYASGVRVNGGTVSFFLNEAADNVTVVLDGGASTQDLGARAKGTHTFNSGTATSFQIVVKKDSAPGYIQGALNQISSDADVLNRFVNQRGVTVNKNSGSPAFGRIYVSVSQAGANTASGRTLGDGIYVLNADQTEVAGLGTNALTGGINFQNGTSGNAESPHRITLGPDDNLYIGDWSDTSGSLYVTDVNVANGQNALPGPIGSPFPVGATRQHGSISGAWIEGSLAAGNLTVWVIDEDLQTDPTSTAQTERNSLWRWDIGAGPLPAAGPPTRIPTGLINFASQLADVTRGPDGKFYVSQRRAAGNEGGVMILSADGSTILANSLTQSRTLLGSSTTNDILTETVAIDVSPDGKYLGVLRRDNAIFVVPLVDGIIDLASRQLLITSPSTVAARDIAFDAAGNLYTVGSGNGLLRVYSPGGRTTATTSSDGSFTFTNIPVPFVSVAATDPDGAEEGSDPVTFTLTRNNLNLDQPLTVHYTLTGLAENGIDYPTDALAVSFPANETTATVTITPIDDTVAEFTETVVLTIVPSIDYGALNPSTATATILDNDPVTLRLTIGSKTNVFEPLAGDTMTLTVSRMGNLALDIFSVALITSGTATEGVDYILSTNGFGMAPGQVTQTVTISPLNDFLLEGDETVTVSIVEGSDYAVDAQNTATGIIRDDEQPTLPVLFSEDFSTDQSANWQVRFGANNGIYDATVNWTYDYSAAGIGPAPNTRDGSTLGLFAAVNKNDATAGGSAGINLYPLGQSFSGDYALRFDMYLSFTTPSTGTEHALLGLNTSGTYTNRATQSADPNNTTAGGDGLWVGIVTDASNLEDYSGYMYPTAHSLPTIVVRRAASTLTGLITSPPYGVAGSPSSTGNNKAWSEVELSQVSNVIALKVNDILIWKYTNTTAATSGDIMLGMNDQFDSIGNAQNFVVFDNVRVVNLSTDIRITSVQLLAGNQIQIDFSSPAGGDAIGYTLRTKPNLNAALWTSDGGAAITSLGGTDYRAVATRSPGEGYYSISKP